ncbi:MAG: hypothetical protein HZB79_04020 [Deltaproteobacteria bacterium]|nr:hypothetical protein [Deltaproteobacteria bacterium]
MIKTDGKKKKKVVSGKDKKAKQASDSVDVKVTKQETAAPKAKQMQAILVFSLRPLDTPKKLLQQIAEQQRSHGHTAAPKCIAKAGTVKDLNDKAFITETLRKEFPDIIVEELIKRTNVYSFHGSDGNNGKYFVVFDKG